MLRIPLILLLLTALLPAQLKVQGWNDTPPQNYPKLNYNFVVIPAEQNGLNQLISTFKTIEDDPLIDQITIPKKFRELDKKTYAEFFTKHAKNLTEIDTLIRTKKIQPPKIEGPDSSMAELFKLFRIGRLLSNQIQLYIENQDLEKALVSVETLTILSKKIDDSNSALLGSMISTGLNKQFYQHAYLLAQNPKITRPQLTKLSSLLPSDANHLRNSIKAVNAEFNFSRQAIFEMYADKEQMVEVIETVTLFQSLTQIIKIEKKRSLTESTKFWILHTLIKTQFQPNKTVETLAQHSRLLKDLLNKPYAERKELNEKYEQLLTSTTNWKNPLSTNMAGRLLFQMGAPSIKRTFLKIRNEQLLYARLTTLLIATRQYHLENITLPNTLTDLSPKYLKTIPLDPYTGKPFTYNKAQKTITSAGPKKQLENPEPFDPQNYTFTQIHNQQTPTLLLPF